MTWARQLAAAWAAPISAVDSSRAASRGHTSPPPPPPAPPAPTPDIQRKYYAGSADLKGVADHE